MNKALIWLLLVTFLLAACSTPTPDPPAKPIPPTAKPDPTAIPSATPTELPPVVLTLCTANLPDSLFPYAGSSSAAHTRLTEWLFPSAFTVEGGVLEPLILEKIPSQADGDLRLEPVPVRRGQTVVDARGELVTALEGAWLRPSGCRTADCAITWNGLDPLEMDQMVIDFTLRENLAWTDSTPVTPADAVFNYRLASDPASPAYGWAEARTQSFSAWDARTLSWRGYPGFATSDLARIFWVPLPSHRFDAAASFETVAADEIWTTVPPSYGLWALESWGASELRLARNPGDPHTADNLPGVDQVVLRLVEGGAGAGWAALQQGTCDALDASFRLAEYPEVLAAISADGAYDVRVEAGESWTQLVFGMRPVEYDTLANPIFAQRPDYFADPRLRQGVAHCLDRQSLAAQTHTEPWTSFLSPAQSLYKEGIPYDPAVGAALLEAVGWRDHDDDPATPRLSQNVLTVFDGIPLTLTLLVGESPFHQDLAAGMVESQAACGVGVNVETLPPSELYAPGPGGVLFGRGFDLALIAWQPLPGPDCGLYHSWAIPSAENGWLGTNIAGFVDEGYDAACSAAGLALPEDVGTRLAEAEAAFMGLLPSVPLVAPPVIEVWRK